MSVKPSEPAPAKAMGRPIPYKIAVLVYIFNDAGQLLLLHRRRPPNRDLYSPIGGKLEQHTGESPHACALREIEEEIALRLSLPDIRLLGIVSERAYTWHAPTAPAVVANGDVQDVPLAAHWLMFCFEVNDKLDFPPRDIAEGRLEWINPADLDHLPIPRTDRQVIWPLIRQYSRHMGQAATAPAEFFCVHIDCTDADRFIVTHEHPR